MGTWAPPHFQWHGAGGFCASQTCPPAGPATLPEAVPLYHRGRGFLSPQVTERWLEGVTADCHVRGRPKPGSHWVPAEGDSSHCFLASLQWGVLVRTAHGIRVTLVNAFHLHRTIHDWTLSNEKAVSSLVQTLQGLKSELSTPTSSSQVPAPLLSLSLLP